MVKWYGSPIPILDPMIQTLVRFFPLIFNRENYEVYFWDPGFSGVIYIIQLVLVWGNPRVIILISNSYMSSEKYILYYNFNQPGQQAIY